MGRVVLVTDNSSGIPAELAAQLGIRVVGLSCITNAAAGISSGPLSHEEVAETAECVRLQFADLLAAAIALS